MRLALLVLAAACTREPDTQPAARPPMLLPVRIATKPAPPRSINLQTGGLAVWRHQTCGCMWRVDVDFATHTIIASDPDGKPWTRTLDDREVRDFLAMADDARTEPALAQRDGFDSMEQLDITVDDDHRFEVRNGGPITRPAAAKLVAALNAAARWPKVD